MKYLNILLLLFSFSTLVYSQDKNLTEGLKNISDITDDEKRLKAYDNFLESFGIKKTKENAVKQKWLEDIKLDPFDDSKIITFVLPADSGQSIYGKSITLIIRSNINKDEVYINWNSYLGSDALVAMRIGTDIAETTQWDH